MAASDDLSALRGAFLWAVRVRWLVILGFFGLACVAASVGLLPSVRPFADAAAVASIVNALNHWSVRRGWKVLIVTALAVSVDVLLITYVVVQSGGAGSPFVMMYVVQVVATAMLVGLAVAAGAAFASAVSFVAATFLERAGVIAVGRFGNAGAPDETAQLVWGLFLVYCLALLTYLGGYVSERLRDSERDLRRKKEELERTVGSLRRAHGELAATHRRLLDTEAQLVQSEKMRAVGQFVAGIAHELNNPISFIAGNVDHLRRVTRVLAEMLRAYREAGAPEVVDLAERCRHLRVDEHLADLPDVLDDCEEGARRAKEIVAALRSFARGESGEHWGLSDVNQGLGRSLSLLRPRLKDVRVERHYGPVPRVESIAGQLDQVFLNLLVNALDAAGDAGTVVLTTWVESDPAASPSPGPHAVVSIRDDGVGIAEEDRSRLFDPFFTTKDPGRGTGLGLSVSYGIVARHGGAISVDSAPGRGSEFVVYLPLRRPAGGPAVT